MEGGCRSKRQPSPVRDRIDSLSLLGGLPCAPEHGIGLLFKPVGLMIETKKVFRREAHDIG